MTVRLYLNRYTRIWSRMPSNFISILFFNVNPKPEVGIRDKGPRDPASRSRIFGTGTGTGTDFQLRARDRDRRSGPARDPGRDAGLKIEKNGTRDGTRD